MTDMTPDELRKWADFEFANLPETHAKAYAAADAWEKLEKSWLALLRQVSKLDPETQDWDGADDGTFLEEFDPWVILRRLVVEGNGPACNPYEGMTQAERDEYVRAQEAGTRETESEEETDVPRPG